MKYIYLPYHIEDTYMWVNQENKCFHIGLAVVFDKKGKFKGIDTSLWADKGVFKKSVKEITKEEFISKYRESINQLNKQLE